MAVSCSAKSGVASIIHDSFVAGSTIAILDTLACWVGLSHFSSQHSFIHPA